MNRSEPRRRFAAFGLRLHLRLACAAIVAYVLCQLSNAACANVVEFAIVQDFRSSIQLDFTYAGTVFGGTKVSATAQQLGSNLTRYVGNMYVDLQPPTAAHPFGTIQLLPGSSVRAVVSGSYSPAVDALNHPIAGTQDANYGYSVSQLGLTTAYRELRLDFPSLPTNGPQDLSLSGSFDVGNLALFFASGSESFLSPGFTNTVSMSGVPFTLAGFGAWNGTTLTIPIFSNVAVHQPSFGYDETIKATGRLILAPVVPEPSSMLLMALGLLAFLASGRRKEVCGVANDRTRRLLAK